MSEEQVTLDDVTRVLNRWYYTEIRDYASGFVTELKRGDYDDADSAREAIESMCDDAQLVIYTYQAQLVYAASDNSSEADDEIEDCGIEDATAEQRAYFCMKLDVTEEIERQLGESIDEYFDRIQAEREAAEEEAAETE